MIAFSHLKLHFDTAESEPPKVKYDFHFRMVWYNSCQLFFMIFCVRLCVLATPRVIRMEGAQS
jgi:hypothetical protein